MNRILSVKEHNSKSYIKYAIDFNDYKKRKRETAPSLSSYLIDKKSGFVVTLKDGSTKYFSKKQTALEFVDSLGKEETNEQK